MLIGIRVLLMGCLFFSWTTAVLHSESSIPDFTVGFDGSVGVKRATPDSNIGKGLIGLPKDNMFGLVGSQLSGFLQWEFLYSSVKYTSTSQFLPLGDHPVIENSDISGLMGVSYPAFSHSNFWSVSLAAGTGLKWGIKRGDLIQEGYLFGNTYEERAYSTLSFSLEGKASFRFLGHLGLGVKYSASINHEFSSNMLSLFAEGYL